MSKTVNEVTEAELLAQAEYMEKVHELNFGDYDMGKPQKLCFIHSYGCQQNLADTERIKWLISKMGYSFCETAAEADLLIFNTCAVRENAEDRIFGNVGALKKQKQLNPNLIVGLCGCMMQQEHIVEKIKTSYPYVDIIFGTHSLHEFPSILFNRLKTGKRVIDFKNEQGRVVEGLGAYRDGKVKAWLPVMYGCDNFCSYCVVPYVRGRERSRRPEEIIKEARGIVADGYKEITLLGQNVNSYGKGLDEEIDFADLLQRICDIEGDFRLRFMTSHPKDCSKKLIDTIAQCEKICNHIHLPVQSGSDRVLKLMNRGYTSSYYLELIDYAKAKIPNLVLTSDIIVGFPDEQYEDFLQTLELIKKVEYNSLFTFIYSKRRGTAAESMPDNVPDGEKSKWFRELLLAQQAIGARMLQKEVGKTTRVLAEEKSRSSENVVVGRNYANSLVEFAGTDDDIGEFADIKITKATQTSLTGEKIFKGQVE